MSEVWPVVAATGHRPRDIPAEAHGWVRDKLAAGARWLRDAHGTTVGISGMALGTDMWWAQAVLDAGLELHAYVPFPQQPEKWPASAVRTWQRLLDQAAKVHYTGDHYDVRYLHQRNEQMVDAAAAVVAAWSGKREGGTYACLRYAERCRRPIVHLEPVAQRIVGPVASVLHPTLTPR